VKCIKQRRQTDCFSACLASLLEVPLETVPVFWKKNISTEVFYGRAQCWLSETQGLTLATIVRPNGVPLRNLFSPWWIPSRFIATVPVPGDFHSVVVALYGSGLRVVHNPGLWSKNYLREANDFSFLVPTFKKGSQCSRPPRLSSIA
jgi:hypothetical protein